MNDGTDRSFQLDFQDIYTQEQAEISKRRQKHFYDEKQSEPEGLVGLALSGGGIRSATFCLGFLQELHRLKVLRIFDYLSTVSGGGYVGGWWSAWLSREEVLVRAKEEAPDFTSQDIKNAASLVTRLRDSTDTDLISSELKKQMRTTKQGLETKGQLELSIEGQTPEPELVKGLVNELNRFLSQPPMTGAPTFEWPDSTSIKPVRGPRADQATEEDPLAGVDAKTLWTNRIHLEHTYPYELRNIFPPKEQIEPKRKYAKENGTGSEGSLCAWEDPVHHLRLFANYLTPRKGLLSADTWRAVSVITRNLLLTWLILLPILTAVMLLGQVYFLFISPEKFTSFPPGHISFLWVLPPVGILLTFTVAMAIAWLLCNRETTSSTDLIAQVVCFIALGALLVSAFWMIPVSPEHWQIVEKYQSLLIGIGALTLLTIAIMWHWKINREELAGKDEETILRWKREVRRGRFSKAQSQLLVFTSIVAAVLFVSWLSCYIFSNGTGSVSSGADAESSFGWLPFIPALLSAVGGSIFTALRTAPSAGIDQPTSHKPSAISRFIFAVTPGLVVLVLAVLAAWFSHWLLYGALRMALTESRASLDIPMRAAGFLVITLALALAIYEMKDVKWEGLLKPTLTSLVFVVCLMVNASWLWQALVAKIPGVEDHHRWLASAILAFCIIIVIKRAILHEKWKSKLGIRLKHTQKANPKVANLLLLLQAPILGILSFAVLTAIGYLISGRIFLYTTTKAQQGWVLGALVLSLAALAGGAILFRLLTVRRAKQRYVFETRFFKDKKFSKRPELLWALASLCLVLPLMGLCLAHELIDKTPFNFKEPIKEPIVFPIALAVLFISLIALRSLVLHRPKTAPSLAGRAGNFFDWVLGKIPKVNGRKEQAFRLLAFLALTLTLVGDLVVKNRFANASIGPVSEFIIRAEWVFLGVALVVNLPIFGVSVFKLPPRKGFSSSLFFKDTSWVYRRATLWTLSFVCVVLALVTGYLLTNWVQQLSKIELHEGLIPLLLPVAAQCLLMILLEVSWGRRENRRSLWLIGLAYVGIAVIFFMGLAAAQISSAPLAEQIFGPPASPATIDSIRIILGLFASVCVWIVALGWMVDPNSVSMHQFYKARLVRAYLGASNIRRRAQKDKEITDIVAGDDLPLKSLSNCDKGGPYHLINTTLNLVAGRDLATAQRSASSFILSQKYCGSVRTNYRPTEKYMQGQLSLGTAIAASGAAVSPNMGSKKPTAALAMLMTLLNVRLGYWAPTPNQQGWSMSQPRLWPFYLIREFLSQTNDLSSYCYLTDGGHFDNTGLYPLIERGCRFIVLVDCGADPQPSCFQDLGEVIRRCRIDFDAEIDLNLDPLIAERGNVLDRCFVVGEIRYSREHSNTLRKDYHSVEETIADTPPSTGIIVYVKPSVIEEATADVRQYSLENKLFPQQTTANQWFDEAQFESYRRLGMACANSAFEKVSNELGKTPRLTTESIKALFEELRTKFKEETGDN